MNDERFERDLRAVLADEAPDAVPVGLRTSLQQVVAGTGDRSARPGVLRGVGPVVGALASFALVGLVLATVVMALTGRAPGFGTGTGDRSAGASPAFFWDNGVVSLAADEARITAGGRQYLVDPGPISVRSDPGSETYQTLELEWQEHGREMRLYLYLRADGERWWLDEVWTRDGRAPAEWVTYPGPLLWAALGEPWTGDIERTSPDGQDGFRLEGMRLEAFRDGRTRQDPEGCRPIGPPQPSGDGALSEPEPGVVEGTDLSEMTPLEAAGWLAERDLCATWRLYYRTDDQNRGYSEYWCTPPDGEIIAVVTDAAVVTVVVRPLGDPIMDVRPQPPLGWGCG